MKADKNPPIPSKGRRGRQGKTKRCQDEDCGCAGLMIVAASEVTPNDVLFGRGCSQSPGNVAFRQLIAERGDDYRSTKRDMKNAFAERLVDEIASRGGRFLVPVKEGMLGAAAKSRLLGLESSGPTTTTKGKKKGKVMGADFWVVAERDVVAEKVKQGLRDFVAAEDKKQGGNVSSATTNSVRTKKRRRISDCSTRTPATTSSSSSARMEMNVNTSATSLFPLQNSADSASRIPKCIVSSSSSTATSRTEAERTTITMTTGRGESTNTHSVAPPGITAAMLASQSFHDFLSTIALPTRDSGQQVSTRGVALPPTSNSVIAIASSGTSAGAFPIADPPHFNPDAGVDSGNATQHPSLAHADLSAMRQQFLINSAGETGPVTDASRIPTMGGVAAGHQLPYMYTMLAPSLMSSIHQATHTSSNTPSSMTTTAASLPFPFANPTGAQATTCSSSTSQLSNLPISLSSGHSTTTHAGPSSIANTSQMPTQAQCPPPQPLEAGAAAGDDDFNRVLGWLQQQ